MLKSGIVDPDKRNAQIISDSDELRPEEKAYVARVRAQQEEFQAWIGKNKRLSPEEALCFQHQDLSVASRYWFERAGSSFREYDEKHEHGWRYWSSSAEMVAASACQFMKDFKPLVEAASNSGPYAAIAIGTMSGLFAIAKAKRDVDDTVSQAMAGIMDRLPGCDLLEQVYDGPNSHEKRLRQKVILAYTGIVDFSIAANRYYLQAGFKRWLDATFFSTKFEELAKTVQSHTTAVRLISEDILPAVVKQIQINTETAQKQNEDLKVQNEDLKKQLSRLQKDSTDRNILQLQNLLNLQEWSSETQQKNFTEYEQSWERARQNNKFFEWMNQDKCHEYMETKSFSEWLRTDASGMLLILGRGHERCARSHCWMSPVAWHFVKKDEVAASLAYTVLDYESYTNIHVTISVLLLQLLKMQESQDLVNLDPKLHHYKSQLAKQRQILEKPDFLLDANQSMKERAQNEAKRAANDALQEIVMAVASSLSADKTYYIVLDRADRCQQDDQFRLMVILLELIKATPARVKILAVANDLFWDVRDFQEDDLAKYGSLYKKILETQDRQMR